MSVSGENNQNENNESTEDKNAAAQANLDKLARPQGKGSKKKARENSSEVVVERNINTVVENKNTYIALVVIALIAVAAFVGIRSARSSSIESFDEAVENFRITTLKSFNDGGAPAEQLSKKASDLLVEHGTKDFTGAFALEVSQTLVNKGEDQANLDLLNVIGSSISSYPNAIGFFLRYSKVNSLEDTGKFQEAITELEGLAGQELLLDKVYFDLGRLYKKVGNGEKSRASFQWVIENHPDSDHAEYSRALL